jgi:redox-sensitive bicupin YhaK (pirin superfamily)
MIEIRPSQDRGYADHGWLKSFHSFSFADYLDPEHVQFGPLRVINEDRVAPSMGNGSVLRPGDVQRMTAGTGVRHSEFNHAPDQTTHFLQIWVLPAQQNLAPGYEERHFEASQKRGKLALIASGDGRDDSVKVHQDMALYAGHFDGAEAATLPIADGRRAYVHVVRGKVAVNGKPLSGGDAAKLTRESAVTLSSGDDSEVLVFDLP